MVGLPTTPPVPIRIEFPGECIEDTVDVRTDKKSPYLVVVPDIGDDVNLLFRENIQETDEKLYSSRSSCQYRHVTHTLAAPFKPSVEPHIKPSRTQQVRELYRHEWSVSPILGPAPDGCYRPLPKDGDKEKT